MKLTGEYGTGKDTLRCLALATRDEIPALNALNLQVIIIQHISSDIFEIGNREIRRNRIKPHFCRRRWHARSSTNRSTTSHR